MNFLLLFTNKKKEAIMIYAIIKEEAFPPFSLN
mgnify:CR=1 FL=1